jgi:hypothetical protein
MVFPSTDVQSVGHKVNLCTSEAQVIRGEKWATDWLNCGMNKQYSYVTMNRSTG